MEPSERAEGNDRNRRNRRQHTRYTVDDAASLFLVHHGYTVPCRIFDLSLGGCRIHTTERFLAGMMVRVEVSFNILGVAFRVSGVTQWTAGKELVGVRFLDMSDRKREQLKLLIEELEEREKPAVKSLTDAS